MTPGLFVTRASPLITPAAGEALDCLTLRGIPVINPDMVYAAVLPAALLSLSLI